MKMLLSSRRFKTILLVVSIGLSLTACETIKDPASAKIAIYDAKAAERIRGENWLSGQKDREYYEKWKKIYMNRGFSEKEACIRAADKLSFR